MTLKKPKYIMEGYCKSDLPDSSSRWEFICSLDEREYTLDSILVVDYDVIRICLKKEKEMKCPICGDEIYLALSKKKDWFYCENCEKEVTEPDYGLLLRQSLERDRQCEERRIEEERRMERKAQLERWKKFKSGCAHSAISSSSPSANFIPSNGPSDSPFKSSKETVTVCFQRGEGARPMFNESFDGDKPIIRIKVPVKNTFIKNGEQYYRMICGHGDYIDLLVEK